MATKKTTTAEKTTRKRAPRGPAVPQSLVEPLAVLHALQYCRSKVPASYGGVHEALDMAEAEVANVGFQAFLSPETAERLAQRGRQATYVELYGPGESRRLVAVAEPEDPITTTELPTPEGRQVREQISLKNGREFELRANNSDGRHTGWRELGDRNWHSDLDGYEAIMANVASSTDADGFTAES